MVARQLPGSQLRVVVALLLLSVVSLLSCGGGALAFTPFSVISFSSQPRNQQRRRHTIQSSRSSSSRQWARRTKQDEEQEVALQDTTANNNKKNDDPQQQQPPNWTALQKLNHCASGTQARRILEQELLASSSSSSNKKRLFASAQIPPGASQRGISDGDLAIQTRLVNKKYQIMELIELTGDRDMDRAAWGVLSVFGSSSVAAIVAQQNLPGPEILRFLVVWLLTFAPLALVGYGIKDAEQLQALLVQTQRFIFPAYRQRMVQHEAGHFLMAHLLGFPIQGYTTNAVRNAVSFYPLSDADKGREFANQLGFDRPAARTEAEEDLWPLPSTLGGSDLPFFSKEGRGGAVVEQQSVFRNKKNYTEFLKLPSQNDPTNAWPYRGFDETTIDQLTVVSVAGVCAEILAFGNAEGGVADLSQLRQIFAASQEEMTERERDNRVRYALGYTLSQLRLHLGALDALAEVMDRGGSVAECVLAIETCGNVSGQTGIMGDYELERRKRFQEGIGFIEKSMDTVEDRYAEGKGGGDRKQEFVLAGDDPLYLALAVSFVFLAWASGGGLSLH